MKGWGVWILCRAAADYLALFRTSNTHREVYQYRLIYQTCHDHNNMPPSLCNGRNVIRWEDSKAVTMCRLDIPEQSSSRTLAWQPFHIFIPVWALTTGVFQNCNWMQTFNCTISAAAAAAASASPPPHASSVGELASLYSFIFPSKCLSM